MPKDQHERSVPILLKPSDDEPWRPRTDQDSLWKMERHPRLWRPPTDVFETEAAYTVVVEIAGMRGADFSVTFDDQLLSIRGVRAEAASQKAYHQMEIAYGNFETHIRVPAKVDVPSIEATYTDGFLRVTLPKARSRSVPIEDEPRS